MKQPRLIEVPIVALGSLGGDVLPLLGANLVFGVTALVVWLAAQVSVLGFVLSFALVPPVAGVMRVACRQVRHGRVRFGSVLEPMGQWRLIGLGAAQLLAAGILLLDLLIGARLGGLGGSMLAVGAAYALLLVWMLGLVVWPLLLDPERDGEPILGRLRLGARLVAERPVAYLGLGLLAGFAIVLAAFGVLPLLIFGLVYVSLMAAHYVLPAGDRLEGRMEVDSSSS